MRPGTQPPLHPIRPNPTAVCGVRTFLPPPLLPVKNRRYTAGAFDVGPGRRLYVNRGLGHLIQVRFNVRPEITLFTLDSA